MVLLLGYIVIRAWQTKQTGVVQPLFPGMSTPIGSVSYSNTPESKSVSSIITDTLNNAIKIDEQKVEYVYVDKYVEVTRLIYLPAATGTPYPTYTPAPTQTPYPTQTPLSAIGDWGEGRRYTELYDVWVMRFFVLIVFVAIGFAGIYVVYLDNQNRKFTHREKLEEMRLKNELVVQEKKLEIEKEREPDRKIVANFRNRNPADQNVELSTGNVSKDTLILFCKNYREVEFDEEGWEEVGINNGDLSIIFAELIEQKLLNQYGWIDRIPTMTEVANALSISRDDVLK